MHQCRRVLHEPQGARSSQHDLVTAHCLLSTGPQKWHQQHTKDCRKLIFTDKSVGAALFTRQRRYCKFCDCRSCLSACSL